VVHGFSFLGLLSCFVLGGIGGCCFVVGWYFLFFGFLFGGFVMGFYVDSVELEEWWGGWLETGCVVAWERVGVLVFRICEGVARRFHPRDEDEFCEHVQDAFVVVLDKIGSGRLCFEPGRAPVFNLVTTTVFRVLFSKMNKLRRGREHFGCFCGLVLEDVRRLFPENFV